MAKKLMSWKTKGMNQDLSVSAFNPEFAFENINLRLSTNEGNTLLSWVNERGTKLITIEGDETSIAGIPVGTAIINHLLILFTHQDIPNIDIHKDHIYKLVYSEDKSSLICTHLFYGDLHLSVDYPLETSVSYESENIQKVYWTDGRYDTENNIYNQPRVINIAGEIKKDSQNHYLTTLFDFVPELLLNETVTVKKLLGASGMFASGVIQYAFTYYNKNGLESNIFYTTPLYYISHKDRGASPEDKVDNAFRITVDDVDTNFDYLRIYSILRTSINGTPIVKRIQDIEIANLDEYPEDSGKYRASYLDIGTSGDTVDPTELLYKGGESIVAGTIEQKDNTLFLGNIKIGRNKLGNLKNSIPSIVTIVPSNRVFTPLAVYTEGYKYYNQLISVDSNSNSVPCCGFKRSNYYRLGVQFQHKSGAWSEPVFISDEQVPYNTVMPMQASNGDITIPIFIGFLDSDLTSNLIAADYRKVRGVVVFPNYLDRVAVCQGIAAPTVFTPNHRNNNKDIFAQSSWFFRSRVYYNISQDRDGSVAPFGVPNEGSQGEQLEYTSRDISGNFPYNPYYIRGVEIMGDYETDNKFMVDTTFLTFHSPDVEFDTAFSSMSFANAKCYRIGNSIITTTMSSIEILTETPTISNRGSGFVHKSFTKNNSCGIVAGLFYDDYAVDDDWGGEDTGLLGPHENEEASIKWMIYPWHKDGSLNNDINRQATLGTPTALLKKKIISNLRFADTSWIQEPYALPLDGIPLLFSSDEVTIAKINNKIYEGNVDTILMPDHTDGLYMAFEGLHVPTYDDPYKYKPIQTDFTSTAWAKTFSDTELETTSGGFRKWENNIWNASTADIGDDYVDLVLKKEGVKMKYKSTPHLIFRTYTNNPEDYSRTIPVVSELEDGLPIIELRVSGDKPSGAKPYYRSTMFGGISMDAKKENIWVPCGEPVRLGNGDYGRTVFKYEYGDTYYLRWDCLKTYPFTREDTNQIVEIGSFMLETYVNIDGRYDRNRGLSSNVNMSPVNFNLLNPVYSLINNFFTYKILDEDYYKETEFSNQITWSKTKESGADIDLWTNITLASILELDGDKGKLNKLIRLNNQILAFLDTGISQILYNENVQISSTDGVPIEIANSGKVQGKRYLSNTIGCSNKWSMVTTPAGIYFMDSHDKSIYLFNGLLINLSNQGGFSSWAKSKLSLTGEQWNPMFSTFDFVSYYDKLNQDILFINQDIALAWSEKLQTFTSFYNYGGIPYFCNLDDTGIWIKPEYTESGNPPIKSYTTSIWKHQASDSYCNFFDVLYPYSMTIICNQEPQTDKIFTNLEFRACVDGEGTNDIEVLPSTFDETFDDTFQDVREIDKYRPYLPFDYFETWNEYQHGIAYLKDKDGHSYFRHHTLDKEASLKRKFRIWRCDVPRDNYGGAKSVFDRNFDNTFKNSGRKTRPMDRMRNPWLYLKLMKKADQSAIRTEIHDLVITYFN